MAKKSKGRKKAAVRKSDDVVKPDIPIPNLPDNYLWMHVNSGTKIRNVLNYSLKEFLNYKSVVWSGAGQGIGKVITCAEVFKRKNPGLHQITKLRYIKSKISEIDKVDNDNRNVPEIHILLAKDSLDSAEPGYQSPANEDNGLFKSRKFEGKNLLSSEDENLQNKCLREESQQKKEASTGIKLSHEATEEFAAMGLRTGRKRSHKGQNKTKITSVPTTSSHDKSSKKGKMN